VGATKIAVLLLAGLFKIEHILENAPTFGSTRFLRAGGQFEEPKTRKF
jgi:hypothetical protein